MKRSRLLLNIKKFGIMFKICDKVFFLNTASGRVEDAEIQGVQIVPTGISKNEKGENVLDGQVVLYKTVSGPVLSETEVFASADECKKYWVSVLESM